MLRSDDKVTNSFRKTTKEANKCLGEIRDQNRFCTVSSAYLTDKEIKAGYRSSFLLLYQNYCYLCSSNQNMNKKMKTTAEILDILHDFKAHYAEKYGIITLGCLVPLPEVSTTKIATLIFV